MNKPRIIPALTIFAVLLFASCSRLSTEKARAAFLKEHPTYTLLHLDTGEGWDGVVTYHFYYKKPDNENQYQEAWTFERQDDGKWKVTGRWTPK